MTNTHQIVAIDESGNIEDVPQDLIQIEVGTPTFTNNQPNKDYDGTPIGMASVMGSGPSTFPNGNTGGIGNNMNLQASPGAAWGTAEFSKPVSILIKHPYDSAKTQTLNGRVNGKFAVYRLDHTYEYLLFYIETGEMNPGQLVENNNDARGWYLGKFENQFAPYVPNTDGSQLFTACHWVASSPATVNQNTSHQDMVVDSSSQNVNVSSGEDGIKYGYDSGKSTQIWISNTTSIASWGINETSDASQNKTSWSFHQQVPFETDDVFRAFKENWKDCFDIGKKTDSVKGLPNLSTNTLQYSTTSILKFESTNESSLVVEFRGISTFHLGFLHTPDFRSVNHHKLFQVRYAEEWVVQLDLVSIVKQGF